jgi:Tol biopolymer transport system component
MGFVDGNSAPRIWVVGADGTGARELLDEWATDPTWSPDGTKIAFASDRDGNFEIYVMDADGTAQTRLTINPGNDSGPTWQP